MRKIGRNGKGPRGKEVRCENKYQTIREEGQRDGEEAGEKRRIWATKKKA